MARDFQPVIEQMSFTEGPRWHEGRLWISDFYTHAVYSAREDGSDLRTEAEVPAQPSGLGWLPDGRLLVVSARDHRVLRREADGSLATHADLTGLVSGQLNDMVVDGSGRAFVGNFGFDLMGGGAFRPTNLHRVDPDGTVTEVADDLYFPNGAVLTADGTLLVNETIGNRISAFTVTPDGELTDRRVWASFGAPPTETEFEKVLGQLAVGPDGCALDDEGCLWIADALGNRALRIRGGDGAGEVVEEISPDTGVYACALGGDDGRTLFLCTAPDFFEHNRAPVREARVLATRV